MVVIGLINSLVAYLSIVCVARVVQSELICTYQGTRVSTLDCKQLGNSFNYLSANGPSGLTVHQREQDLKSLDLSDCNIVNVSRNYFKRFPAIETLDISKNVLSDLFLKPFSMLSHLVVLNLSHNALGILGSDSFEEFNQLKVLDLSFNMLNIVSYSGFEVLPNLRILDLSQNFEVDLLHVKFGNSLMTLKMSSVSVVLHADAFLNLLVLKRLQLSFSQLNKLPQDMLKTMPDLTAIVLSSNQIVSEDLDGISGDTFQYNLKLIEIDLSSNSLTVLPRGLFSKNVKLRKLDLSRNEIPSFDYKIFNANINLVYLDISFNQLNRLHAGLFAEQKNLQHLDLAHNTIGYLDGRVFSNLIDLESLNLEGNRMKYMLGHHFANNHNLQRLSLSKNQLTTVPQETLDSLSSLISLDLEGNYLTTVSAKFFKLPNIQILNIGCNNLTQLSQDFFEFYSESRRQIKLGGNPWKCPCIMQSFASAADNDVDYGLELFGDGAVGFCVFQEDNNICDDTPLNSHDLAKFYSDPESNGRLC